MEKMILVLVFFAACSTEGVVTGSALATADASVSVEDSIATGADSVVEVENKEVQDVDLCAEKICDDGNLCTTDFCDSVKGCMTVVNENVCDDGDACLVGESCKGGVCYAGPAVNCLDDDPCTSDSCDPIAGCIHKPLNCVDDDAWTVDVCRLGGCYHLEMNLLVYADVFKLVPETKDPNKNTPVFFVGNEDKVVYNLLDKWIPYVSYTSYSMSLKSICKTKYFDDKPHWDTGYTVKIGGYSAPHVMLGGHHLKTMIVVPAEGGGYDLAGPQPVFLPLSGTQEYAADGSPIPQHYVTPNLNKICEDYIADQKVLDGK